MSTFIRGCLLSICFLINVFSVRAQALTGDIRLRGGDIYYGRVEIFYDDRWGTVCDDLWDISEATVVCRQLGYGAAITAHDRAYYGEGDGDIWLDNVQCSGYENRLSDCSHQPWGQHDCTHREDVGVECLNATSHEDIRLRGGGSDYGRVEVLHSGQWGTVCDDDWDLSDAIVVCRQLGFSTAVEAKMSAFYGQGDGDIWLDDVQCLGYEYWLSDCPHRPWGVHNCEHSEDAGVVCSSTLLTPPPYEGSARLVGGFPPNTGRVEIFYNGHWGTVCDDEWERSEAEVICRQLGYTGVDARYSGAYYGEGTGPIMYQLGCSGYEMTWTNCGFEDWDTSRCSHSEDASVMCSSPGETYAEGEVRLVGEDNTFESAYSGTVQIYHNGEWGTVCDDQWDIPDADVVCRQLGFTSAFAAFDNAHYGPGSGPILLDEVRCNGGEHNLVQCDHNDYHNCVHSEDAGVQCEIPVIYYPRLVDGDTWYEGRLEVWDSYRWEKVCDIDPDVATTVCKQLGFEGYQSIYYDGRFGEGNAPPSDVYFICNSNDDELSSCDTYPFSSGYHCRSYGIGCSLANYDTEDTLSVGAIIGIVSACSIFCIVCLAACVVTLQQSKRRRNQQTPAISTISGADNHTATFNHHLNVSSNVSAPPFYNTVINHPMYYPPAAAVNPAYPPQPNQAYPPNQTPGHIPLKYGGAQPSPTYPQAGQAEPPPPPYPVQGNMMSAPIQ